MKDEEALSAIAKAITCKWKSVFNLHKFRRKTHHRQKGCLSNYCRFIYFSFN